MQVACEHHVICVERSVECQKPVHASSGENLGPEPRRLRKTVGVSEAEAAGTIAIGVWRIRTRVLAESLSAPRMSVRAL